MIYMKNTNSIYSLNILNEMLQLDRFSFNFFFKFCKYLVNMVDEPITMLLYLVFNGDDILSVLMVNFNYTSVKFNYTSIKFNQT